MLKSLSKKGFTLVEVLCSLAVFSIIFICAMSFDVASLNMEKDIRTMNNNVLIMETLKNNIIYAMTYEELVELETDKKNFVNKKDIIVDQNEIVRKDAFLVQEPTKNPYVKLTFSKPGPEPVPKSIPKVYKVNISLYSGKPKNSLELQCNFYKGCHK